MLENPEKWSFCLKSGNIEDFEEVRESLKIAELSIQALKRKKGFRFPYEDLMISNFFPL